MFSVLKVHGRQKKANQGKFNANDRSLEIQGEKKIKDRRKKCFVGNNASSSDDYMLQITMKKKKMLSLLK